MNANIKASGLFSSSTLLDYSGPQSSLCLSHYLHERQSWFVHVWIHLKESGLQRERRYWPTAGGRSANVGWHHKLPAALYPLHQFFRWVGGSIRPALLHSIHFIVLPSGDLHPISVCEIFCVRINRLRESGRNGMFEGGRATERRELHFSVSSLTSGSSSHSVMSQHRARKNPNTWFSPRHFHRNQKFTETFRRFKLYFI